MKDLKNLLNKYAFENNLDFSSMSDRVIEAVVKNEGNCPCRTGLVPCPCPMSLKEVEEQGRCTCNLFVKKK